MPTLFVRTLSGVVYVATIVIPLLYVQALFPVFLAIYTVLIWLEYRMIVKKSCRLNEGLWFCRPLIKELLGLAWIIFPMILVIFMPELIDKIYGSHGVHFTLLLFVFVWIHDTFAYLVGVLAGKHPLAPRISPSKTIEGAIGGVIFTLIFAFCMYIYFPVSFTKIFWLASALIIAISANIGDLAESKMKRLAGLKDSGKLMPGHGGFFDRFDAILVVAPFWVLWLWLMS